MNTAERKSIKRILVALDDSPHSRAALEAAAELAARLGVEVAGLFVEDDDLLRSAGLPFARQIGVFCVAPLDADRVHFQLQVQAERARRHLARASARLKINWSFRVARGQVIAEVSDAATDSDLVILGRRGWSGNDRRSLGSTARQVLERGPQVALVVREGVALPQPVIVLYDASAAGRRALALGVELALSRESGLRVLLSQQEDLNAEVEQQLSGYGGLAYQVSVLNGDLGMVLRTLEPGLVVVPCGLLDLDSTALQELIDKAEAPALVVGRC